MNPWEQDWSAKQTAAAPWERDWGAKKEVQQGVSSSPADVKRIDNQIEARVDAAPQDVVTSSRAWNGAGAGRGGIIDSRRLDAGDGYDRSVKAAAITKILDELRRINPGVSDEKLVEMASATYDPSTQQIGSQDNTGQNTQAYMDKARENLVYQQGMDKIKESANANPISSSLGSGLLSAATGLANAPQAIVNAPLEYIDRVGGALTGKQISTPKLPKWGFTKEAMDIASAGSPDVANKELGQSWGDGDFGTMLLANLAQNAPSSALSVAAMFAPPLRAALLPTMGAMSAGQNYAQGDSAVASVLKGGLEIGTEMLPLGAFDRVRDAVNKLPLPNKTAIAAAVARKIAQVGGEVTATALTNFVEEAAAQFGGNVVDRAVQNKKGELSDGVLKAGVIGMAAGAAHASPAIVQRAMEPMFAADPVYNAEAIAKQKGFLTSFADPNGPASKAGITPIVIPVTANQKAAPNVSTPDATQPMGTGAVDGGGNIEGAGVGTAGLGNVVNTGVGDSAGTTVASGTEGAPVPRDTTQPIASVNPIARSADADLLSRIPEDDGTRFATKEEAVAHQQQQGIAETTEVVDTAEFGGTGFAVAPKTQKETIGGLSQQQAAVSGLAAAIQRSGADASKVELVTSKNVNDPTSNRAARFVARIAAVAKSAFGIDVIAVRGINGYGVAHGSKAFANVDDIAADTKGEKSTLALVVGTIGHEAGHSGLEKSKDPEDRKAFSNLKVAIRQYLVDGVVDRQHAFENEENRKEGTADATREGAENEVIQNINGAMWMDSKFWGLLHDMDNGSTMRRVAYRFMQAATKFIKAAKGSDLDINTLVKNRDEVRKIVAAVWAQKAMRQGRMPMSRTQIEAMLDTPPTEAVNDAAFKRKGVIGEVAPNPDQSVAQDWNAMEDGEKSQANRDVGKKVAQAVMDIMGLRGWDITFSSGTYEGKTNPNFIIEAPDSATQAQIDEFAKLVGYALDQKAMVTFDESNTTGNNLSGFVKVVLPAGMPEGKVKELRAKIAEVAKSAGDDTLRDGGLVFGNYRGEDGKPFSGIEDDAFRQQIRDAVSGFDWDGGIIDVSQVEKYASQLIWPDNRDGYLEGTRYGTGSGLQSSTGGEVLQRDGQGGDLARLERLGREFTDLRQSWKRAARARERVGESVDQTGFEVEYGRARVGAVARVGVHFSQQRRGNLSSEYHGQGLQGAERDRMGMPGAIKDRLYFYVDIGQGVHPEAGVGGIKHTVKLNNLYDINKDQYGYVKAASNPDPLKKINNWEKLIRNAGFDGYVSDNGGNQAFAILLGKHNIELPAYKRRSRNVEDYNEIGNIDDLGGFNLDRAYAESNNDDLAFPDLSAADKKLDAAQPTEAEMAQRLRDEIDDAKKFKRLLERELNDAGFAVVGTPKQASAKEKNFAEVKPAEIKAKGMMAEEAYPDLEYHKDPSDPMVDRAFFVVDGKRYRATVSSSSPKIDSGAFEANAKKGAKGVMSGYEIGGLSDQAKKDWNKRFAASADLMRRNFDIYTSVPAAARDNVLALWKNIAANPDAFEFAKAENVKGANVKEVAQDIATKMMAGGRYEVRIMSPEYHRGTNDFSIVITDTKTGATNSADVEFWQKEKQLVMHTHELDKGSGMGKPVYQIGQAFADKFGARIDADGILLGVNNYRRTEQMFSGALRSGNFDTMQPGIGQRIYGWNERTKTQEQKDRNLVRVALASTRNALEFAPSLKKFGYDLKSNRFFLLKSGDTIESRLMAGVEIKSLLSKSDVRVASISRSTLARAVLTLRAIDGDVATADEIESPVLYSRRHLDSYMDERNKSMKLASPQSVMDADIDTAVKAINAALQEIDVGNRDTLPVPLGRTPHVLAMLRLQPQMLRIDTSILRKIFSGKHEGELGDITPNALVRSIYQPALVLKGGASDEFEIVTSLVTPKGVVFVPIKINTGSVTGTGKTTSIKSIFAKNVSGGGGSIVNKVKAGDVLYADPEQAQVAVTGRGSVTPIGVNAREAQFSDARPIEVQDSTLTARQNSVKPLNPNFVGWDRVRDVILDGISKKTIKSDVDLMRWIGNNYKAANSPDGWDDAPAFKRKKSPIGFYSALSDEIGKSSAKAQHQEGWRAYTKGLINKGAVKADEVEWTGLNDWLELQTGKVTKEAVQAYLDGNGVQVQEVTLGEKGEARSALDFLDADTSRETKYSQYTLPGGENYREVLLTLPEKAKKETWEWYDPDSGESKQGFATQQEAYDDRPGAGAVVSRVEASDSPQNYRSSHWDQPNILAHIRVNDRTDADGKRVLFIEEIQSDFGQDIKKNGAAGTIEAVLKVNGMTRAEFDAMPTEDRRFAIEETKRLGLPPVAPFVTKTDAWLNLALKRVITIAVDGGYDKVAFVNGEQSANRYDLSEQVKSLSYQGNGDGTFKLTVDTGHGGEMVGEKIEASKLEDYVGKEVAQKILDGTGETQRVMDGTGKRTEWKTMTGLDLKVGGEGMKTFYDKIVPTAAKKLVEKFDGKMGDVSIYKQGQAGRVMPEDAKPAAMRDGRLFTQSGFIITDAMRNKASDGLPLFKRKQFKPAQGLPEETRMQGIQRTLQDKYSRVKMVQDLIADRGGLVGEEQDVYAAEERMHGRVHENLREFADEVVHPLVKKAVKLGVDLNELAAYAYAKHAAERNAHIQQTNQHVKTGSGMSDDEAANIIQLVRHSGDAAAFDELHNDLMAITATTRRLMLDEGLITQDQYDGLENQYENYVPLRGFEDVDPDSGSVRPGLGRGFQTKGAETIKAMGRDSKAGDIIENIIRDYERITIRAERNSVGKTFLDLVTSNPDPNLWEVQPITRATRSVNGLVQYVDVADKGDETISVKVAGKQVYIKINDPLLLRAMQNTFKAETSDAERFVVSTVGQYTSLLRNTITRYNPAFGVINAVRDAQMGAAGVLDALGAEGLRRYTMNYGPAAMASGRVEFGRHKTQTHQMDKWMREMRFAGGTTGGVFMRDHETIRNELRDAMLQAGAKPDGVIELARSTKAFAAVQHTLHALELIGSMSENTARLAAYATAREMGKTPAQAASIAKNLTVNFNRFGEQGQIINTMFLFYNASVQGSVRIYQMMKNPKVQAAMAGMASAGAALALMAAAVGGDDEDGEAYWDKIPDFEKERNLIIMLPPGSDSGAKIGTHGRYVKIPMAYGLNVFPVLGYQIADLIRHAKDPARGIDAAKAGINMLSAVAGSYNPMGGSFDPRDKTQLALAVSPTIVDAGIQLYSGVNGFGQKLGPEKSTYSSAPDSENVSAANHGRIEHRIARWLNEKTGGNQARPGAIDVEPGTIKNLEGIVGGGLGKFVGDVINLGYLGAMDAPVKDRDIPMWKAFYGEYDAKAGMSQFYERSQKARAEFDTMKAEAKAGVKRDYSADEKFLQYMGGYAENMGKAMGELKKWEVSVAESNKTEKEKEFIRREIQRKREALAERYNRDWYARESKLKRAQ